MRKWLAERLAPFNDLSVILLKNTWSFRALVVSLNLVPAKQSVNVLPNPLPLPEPVADIDYVRELRALSISHVFAADATFGNETCLVLPQLDCHSYDLAYLLSVSDNLLPPLGFVNIKGRDYSKQPVPSVDQRALWQEEKRNEAEADSGFRKAYRERTDNLGIVERQTLNVYDLIFPYLRPPLDFSQPSSLLPNDPYPFQVEGVRQLVTNEAFLLADEMGTGKTVMTCLALSILFQLGRISNALIVCPRSILGVWDRHLRDWAPSLQATVVYGPRERRKHDWRCPAHVYVVTYDTLRNDLYKGDPTLLKYVSGESLWGAAVIDEAHHVKNPRSGKAKALEKVASRAKYRWALTGTPIQNSIDDLGTVQKLVLQV